MERYELPDGWEWKTVGECCDVNRRDPALKNMSDDTLVSFVPMAAVDADQGAIAKPVDRPFSEVRKGFTPFSNGDVIFAKITPSMENGKAAIANGLTNGFGFGSTEFHVMHPKDSVIAEWVFHFIRQQSFRDEAKGSFAGTAGQLRVPEKFILNTDIPLAPIPEQQRIISKIERLFEQSRTARTALTHVPVLMAQFRRAVLDSATSGRLTEEWRETHPDAPEHRSVSLREVATEFKYGTSAKSQKSGEVPVLRMGNIQDRKLDWNDLVFTSDKNEIEKYRLTPGDVLFNRTNSPELVGKTAIYKGERPAIYAGYLIRVKCSDALLPDYLNYCLNSPAGRDWASQVKSDGVSQSNINAQKLADFKFDLPPIEEQIEIVSRVEKVFAQADIVEQAASVSLRRAEQVDQSILARAFRGELR